MITLPRLLTVLLVFVISISALSAQTSVWKVSRGDRFLYLGGTCHVLRPTDFPLPAEFDTAYAASSKIVFETDIRRIASPEMQTVVQTHGMFSDGRTLKSVLTPSAWKALTDYCQNAGLPIDQMQRMKPWLFTVMMTAMELQKLGMASEGVDIHYFRKASDDGKTLGMLESFEDQVAFLTQLGAGNESELIEKSLEDLDELSEMMTKVLAAWRSGDMSALDRLLLNEVRTKYPAIFQSLFVERNNAWMPKIEELLQTPAIEFVLVGAGHLPGPEGILSLLEASGCTIEQLAVSR